MKICVFGAGAIGGYLATQLAAAGQDVSVVAREATCKAISKTGLTLLAGTKRITVKVRVSPDPATFGPQDAVFLTVKTTALASAAAMIGPLLAPDTPVIFVQNGIPWWYFYGLPPGAFPHPVLRLSPDLSDAIEPRRTIGAMIFSSNEVVEPGVIRNRSLGHNNLKLGEIDGTIGKRTERLAHAFEASSMAASTITDIRHAVWRKLVLTNISRSPISVLLDRDSSVFENPELRDLSRRIMDEAATVAAAWGEPLEINYEKQFAPENFTAGHVSSMLQDFRLGRSMEIDTIVSVVEDFARAAHVPVPALNALSALLRQRAADAGAYQWPQRRPSSREL